MLSVTGPGELSLLLMQKLFSKAFGFGAPSSMYSNDTKTVTTILAPVRRGEKKLACR